jgi:acetyl-CoA C-acetyltransferase
MTLTAMDPIVILGAARTPMGAFQGGLSGLAAHDLGGTAIHAAVARAGVDPARVDQLLMGNCLMAGQGQAPARQAGFKGGLPQSAGAVTLSKMCGSGLFAAMLAHDMLRARSVDLVVAGGMESMSNAPHLLPQGRSGIRIGHGRVLDHMMLDGLEDAYEPGRSMGSFGEDCAAHYGFSRAAQDAFATTSVQRAQAAIASGAFAHEITPVAVRGVEVGVDEAPGRIRLEKIPTLPPAFKPGGSITAASSSCISDGAAALVLARASSAAQWPTPPLARIVGHASHAQAPAWFSTAPVGAVQKLLDKIGWRVADVDLWEVNEAFAVVPMALMAELGMEHSRVNIHGGACALGHPIGASGARILVTLLYALRAHGLRRGVATLCIGGGEAVALALELL